MTCDCIYFPNNNTLEGAREMAVQINAQADKQCEEVTAFAIGIVRTAFHATSDYDGYARPFKMKVGQYVIWAHGKDYSMNRLHHRGGKRGFPENFRYKDFWTDTNKYIEDLESVTENKETGSRTLYKLASGNLITYKIAYAFQSIMDGVKRETGENFYDYLEIDILWPCQNLFTELVEDEANKKIIALAEEAADNYIKYIKENS